MGLRHHTYVVFKVKVLKPDGRVAGAHTSLAAIDDCAACFNWSCALCLSRACASLFPVLNNAFRCRGHTRQSYINSFEDDTAPESAAIIPAEHSPCGKTLLIAANEKSNTLAVYQVDVEY